MNTNLSNHGLHGCADEKMIHEKLSRDISGCDACAFVMSSEVETSLIFYFMPRLQFLVYMVTNRNHSVFYIGVTNRLSRRTWEHREKGKLGFASKYQCTKLIYYEHYRDIRDAIARESHLKRWSRAKKIDLINRMNPLWQDLGAEVLQDR
jgi:putative endonuclease